MKNLFVVLIFLISNISLSPAQVSGPIVPTIYSTTGTGASWGNLSGIVAVDNNPAYADLAQYPTCNNFMCYYSNVASFTGFSFNIPSNAVITGIQLDILQRVSSPGGGIHDSSLVLALSGTAYGTDHASSLNWGDSPVVQTYGGNTDNWGRAWTPAEINDPTFGFLYRLTNSSYDQPGSVDHLTMTVYYQTGSGISSQSSSPLEIFFHDNKLMIEGFLKNSGNNYQLRVSNMNGEIIFQKTILQNANVLSVHEDVSLWARGTYVINIISASGEVTRKLILSGK